MQIAALTSGRDVPSSRFRVRQHIPELGRAGFRVTEFVPRISKYARPRRQAGMYVTRSIVKALQPAKLITRLPGLIGSLRADVTWLERELLPGLPALEPLLGRPLVFDVDDAIWLTPPFGAAASRRAAKCSEVVVAGNSFIADWFSDHARRVAVVPTAIDARRFAPPTQPREASAFKIGWTGLSSNLPFLYEIEPALDRFLRSHPDSSLVVVSDAAPRFSAIDPDRVTFVPWRASVEASALQDWDVGVMPLSDDDWSRGKCSFKMLQYMATALPVVVTPVGMNADILNAGDVGLGARSSREWVDSLTQLHADAELRRKLGENGRRLVEERFDQPVVRSQLVDIFREFG